MSAFQVSSAHLVHLIGIMQGVRDGSDRLLTSDCERLFRQLADRNAWNLDYLYSRDGRCSPVPMPEGQTFPDVCVNTLPEIVAAVKVIDCYVYQCCDRDGWDRDDVASMLRQLRDTLLRRLPGWKAAYEAAPWGVA